MIRDIKNYLDEVIGQLEKPDETTEEEWAAALAPYAVAPPTPEQIAVLRIDITIEQRKIYADDLMSRFKRRNISDGINGYQGLWMHHRMRALDITFMGKAFTIDVLNLAISGDIEIAALTLMNATPDDMSEAFHWLSADRINWLVGDMKTFLGWA